MKAYLITTAVVFGLLVAVHTWRLVVEGPGLFKEPFWVLSTVIAAALFLWALRLLFRSPTP